MVKVLFVEGGGNQNAALKTACRKAFRMLLENAGFVGRLPRVEACGCRQETYEAFAARWRTRSPKDFIVLLVDAEEPVVAGSSWAHVKARDDWRKPPKATDDELHLMIECMESWFLADPNALAGFYGHGFSGDHLPKQTRLEEVRKATVLKSLKNATKTTKTKGSYGKGKHSFAILEKVNPALLRAASPAANRFLGWLDENL